MVAKTKAKKANEENATMTSDNRAKALERFVRKIAREEIGKAINKGNRFSSSKQRTRKVKNQSAQR